MGDCLIRRARIYDTDTRDFCAGEILVRGGRIAAVAAPGELPAVDMPAADVYDAEGRLVIPGLVDVHTHGRAGGDFGCVSGEGLRRTAESYLASGVTTVLPTLASAPLDELHAAVDRINALRAASATDGKLPNIAGIHLEGRYLNEKKRGAHAPALIAPLDPEEMADLVSRMNGACHISAALEQDDGEHSFLRRALSLGVTVALGHTMADYATAVELFCYGVSGVAHLFNAMPPLHHRDGGAVAAALLSKSTYCELICDGFHVSPEMVKLAYTLAGDRLVLVSDSMEATGCPDGDYSIAGMPVTVVEGKARTSDGAIAGSTLSLWQGVHNLSDFAGISFENALYAATMAPALEVGIADEVGSIVPGKRADLLVLDNWLTIGRILCGGVWYS